MKRLQDLLAQGVYFTVTEETLCSTTPHSEKLMNHVTDVMAASGAKLWMAEEVIDSIYSRANGGDEAASAGVRRIVRLQDSGVLGTVLVSQNTPDSFDAILAALHELRTVPSIRLGVITVSEAEKQRLETLAVNTPAVKGTSIICYGGGELRPGAPVLPQNGRAAVDVADWVNTLTGCMYAAERDHVLRLVRSQLRVQGIPYAVHDHRLDFSCPVVTGLFGNLRGTAVFGWHEAEVKVFFPMRLALPDQPYADMMLNLPGEPVLCRQGDELYARVILPYAGADRLTISSLTEACAARFEQALPRLLPMCVKGA